MTEHAVILESVFVVRWSPHFSPGDVHDVIVRLTEERRQRRHPLVLVVITDARSGPLADETVDALLHGIPVFDHACSYAFGVVTPESPARRLLVGELEAFRMLSSVPSEICDTLEVALRHAARSICVEPDRVLDAARRSPALETLLEQRT